MRIRFKYLNHRQEVNERDVTVLGVEWQPKPGYGYEPGWFLRGYDHDRSAERSFAWGNIIPDDPSIGHVLFALPKEEAK